MTGTLRSLLSERLLKHKSREGQIERSVFKKAVARGNMAILAGLILGASLLQHLCVPLHDVAAHRRDRVGWARRNDRGLRWNAVASSVGSERKLSLSCSRPGTDPGELLKFFELYVKIESAELRTPAKLRRT